MIELTINDTRHRLDIDPQTPLLYALRNSLGLKGPKFGCGLAECGACAVLVEGRPLRSCVLPVSSVIDRPVTTLEGLGSAERPHALQQAFIEEQAVQCGYCIPGMIIGAQALLLRNPDPGDEEIKQALSAHLCGCGTHLRIVRAVQRAAQNLRKERSA
ncbi:(2Fe-2S)-binding protein [Stutzerimonas tarimensis]|uniref:(2Fe-2S)-binding protein n=1 Tax=Stutzerimonas tarimensis TaxID=1507735 RepID=A0ABV7T1F1_9GAMM